MTQKLQFGLVFIALILCKWTNAKEELLYTSHNYSDTFIIIVKQYGINGSLKEIGKEQLLNPQHHTKKTKPVLGSGRYIIEFSFDSATFNEHWIPNNKMSVNEFHEVNVSTQKWVTRSTNSKHKPITYFELFEKRIQVRYLEDIIESGFISLGFNEKEVQEEIIISDTNELFSKKFMFFKNEIYSEKFTNQWKARTPTSPHRSIKAYNSPELFSSGLCIVIYDGGKDTMDMVPVHIGLIHKRFLRHVLETVPCFLPFCSDCNLATKNMKKIERKRPYH